ncbi:CBO0543 family protein [Metabacillus litoralis]|uniref:CBO0543 family protein n=1 Tax=Metabacillus litoralis TaxID=152268 RepID=UPI001CFF1DE5|nr:CBO0543 family protein [Metabacillus litoralis]
MVHNFLHVYLMNSISFDHLIEVEKSYFETLNQYWRDQNYLTARWWILVVLSVLAPITWWKLVDKKNLIEITAFGLFYGVSAIILDSIGSNAMVWTYSVRLTPYLIPQLYPYDVGVVIVPFMIVYQYWGNKTINFIIAAGFLSAFLAFIAEPVMEWLEIYHEITWKNIYSFPIYWILGIICWFIIKRFKKIERNFK